MTFLNFEHLDELGWSVLFLRSINLVDSRLFFGKYFDAFGENFSKLDPSLVIFRPMLLIIGLTNGPRDESRLHLFWHLLTSRIISSLSFGHNSKMLFLLEPTSLLKINLLNEPPICLTHFKYKPSKIIQLIIHLLDFVLFWLRRTSNLTFIVFLVLGKA